MKPEALASSSERPGACCLASQCHITILVISARLTHLCAAAVPELAAFALAFIVSEAFPAIVEVLAHGNSFDAVGCNIFSGHS